MVTDEEIETFDVLTTDTFARPRTMMVIVADTDIATFAMVHTSEHS